MSEQRKMPVNKARPAHGPMSMMPGEKARDFKGTIKKLVGYLKEYRLRIVFVWILAIASTLFSIAGPKILGSATDILFKGIIALRAGTGTIDFMGIGRITLILLGLYALSSLFTYAQGFIMSKITVKISYRMRNDIDEKIHKVPLNYFDKNTHGDVLSRITNDVDTIGQTMSQSMTQIITSVTSVIGVLIMMLTISWQLSLVALCIVPLTMLFVSVIVKFSQKHFFKQQSYLGKVNGHVEEMISSHVIVKAYCGEEKSINEFSSFNDTLYESAWKSSFLSGLIMPVTNFIGNLGYVMVCILGGYFAITGKISIGGIQSFIQYVRSFSQPMMQIANISNVLQQTAAAAERVFEMLSEEEEVREEKDSIVLKDDAQIDQANAKRVESIVEFDDITFGYDANDPIIHDFSAHTSPGQKIAIVGPTGAGKTTIVKLLMRFYDVDSGAIKIDGNDIRLFKRNDLRSLFGMVLQDTWLFNGTIADNIRYGKLDATDEEVHRAAVVAQADHFINTLPDGYNMILNEEATNISQGQKQLLTIARAVLSNPQMLILDEATSSVDTRTEVLIQKAMDNLMQGRTSFIIAHRLSTIRNADLILFMKDGNIVEQGNHEELLNLNGYYANLYRSQFEASA